MLMAHYLLLDEVHYELRVRNIAFNESDKVDFKKRLLTAALKQQARDGVDVSRTGEITVNLVYGDEIAICRDKLGVMDRELITLTDKNRPRLLSRTLHIYQRLGRLEPPEGTSPDELQSLLDRASVLLGKIDPDIEQEEVDELDEDVPVQGLSSTRRGTVNLGLASEREFVDRFASMLDGSLHRLEESRKGYGSIKKLGVTFSGTNGAQGVLSFLSRVEEQRVASGLSESRLFEGAIDLFTGPALIWYRSIRSQVGSWFELAERIKLDFLPANYELSLWDEIRSRKQGEDESAIIFIASMRGLMSRLKNLPSETEQLAHITNNLSPFFATSLALIDITSINQLTSLCKRLEDTRIVNKSPIEPELAYKPSKLSVKAVDVQAAAAPVTNSKARIPSSVCWNCRQAGHNFRFCEGPRTVFCYFCGNPGVVTSTCRRHGKLSKNGSGREGRQAGPSNA